ncbi:MAG: Na+/H+ antiporter NhaC [Gammaproteobacteria bacterium]
MPAPHEPLSARHDTPEQPGGAVVRIPSMFDALLPLACLIGLLTLSVYLFGSDSSYGPNQVALIVSTVVASLVALKNGHRWQNINNAISNGITVAIGAMLILLSVGALIGTWMLAGTVPTLIHYGLQILNPSLFYAATCLICAVVATAIGSSWTTAGTIGVALMGVALALGLSPEIAAGAVISGSYFGDKMSPLSDTTNLAAAVVGTELFTHIRHMAWTTGPSFLIALVLFAAIGIFAEPGVDGPSLTETSATLAASFDLSPLTLMPVALLIWLALRRVPALPTILAGAALGGVLAVLMQPDRVVELAADPELPLALALVKGVWTALFAGYSSATGDATVDALLSRGGMLAFLNTIFLILTALSFGAVMDHTGLLERLITAVLRAVRGTGSLIASVVGTTILSNIVTADQYMSIVIPGRMFREEFRRRRLKARNLSRTVEDAGTLTSSLVPWNSGGAYMAATLDVATLAYLPFCFLNLINPVIAIIYGIRGIKIDRYDDGETIPAIDEDRRTDRNRDNTRDTV